MSESILNFTDEGLGEPLLILHGLFGSSLNWKSLGRDLAQRYRVLRVDLRNHGSSFHDKRMDYRSMADDIDQLMRHLEIEQAHVLGHSMGGKVALMLAQHHPQRIDRLIVADIAPVAYRHEYDDLIEALMAVDLDLLTSRGDADTQLKLAIPSRLLRQFLLQNLQVNSDGAQWKINISAVAQNIDNITGFEDIADWSVTAKTLFIRGAQSEYISDEHWRLVQAHFSDASLETIENAGHWLHFEQPQIFLATVREFLD